MTLVEIKCQICGWYAGKVSLKRDSFVVLPCHGRRRGEFGTDKCRSSICIYADYGGFYQSSRVMRHSNRYETTSINTGESATEPSGIVTNDDIAFVTENGRFYELDIK